MEMWLKVGLPLAALLFGFSGFYVYRLRGEERIVAAERAVRNRVAGVIVGVIALAMCVPQAAGHFMGLAGGYTLVAGSGAGDLKLHISGSSSVACDWRFTGDVGLLSGELWLCNTFAAGGGRVMRWRSCGARSGCAFRGGRICCGTYCAVAGVKTGGGYFSPLCCGSAEFGGC